MTRVLPVTPPLTAASGTPYARDAMVRWRRRRSHLARVAHARGEKHRSRPLQRDEAAPCPAMEAERAAVRRQQSKNVREIVCATLPYRN